MEAENNDVETMQPDGYEQVLESVGKLSATERKQLLDRLALQHSQDSLPASSDRDLNLWTDAIHEALSARLGAAGGADVGLLVVKRTIGARAAWAPITEFMKASRLAELTVAEKQGAYRMLARLLVDHAHKIALRSDAPLGPRLVGTCAHSIRGVFENAFPGYLRAGLARVVARQAIDVARNPGRYNHEWDD